MKKVKPEDRHEELPITIEFSPKEAKELYSFLSGLTIKEHEKAIENGDDVFDVTADEAEGCTDNLYDILGRHLGEPV